MLYDDEDDEDIDKEFIAEMELYSNIKPLTDEELSKLFEVMNINIKPITEEQIKSILLSLGYKD